MDVDSHLVDCVIALGAFELFIKILITHRVCQQYDIKPELATEPEGLPRPAAMTDAPLGEEVASLLAVVVDVNKAEAVIVAASLLIEYVKSARVILLREIVHFL